MENFYCPNAVKKNAFDNLLCKIKMERNGTKLQSPIECFAAMCPYQDFCDCRKQPQNTSDFRACPELKPAEAESEIETEAEIEETKKPAKRKSNKK